MRLQVSEERGDGPMLPRAQVLCDVIHDVGQVAAGR
jgi:hypothetical protein